MDNTNAKQQAIERLKQANNVLVTVRNNPSVDQLSACIGLTLMLNKLGKHGTAVFSGAVPDTIEFLKPEETLEKNTDSLRDFIIALDKSKADKLRYKVEDKVVKIFITPYRTSISEKDLDFSQGDFNVDVVIALGVQQQQDLDQAITSHGRILHDATVISVNNVQTGNLGNMNWIDTSVSSLSELVSQLDGQIGKSVLDAQIATALLTGIVAETNRFSNSKTSSQTMSISAKLMSAGANQQLVATKLEEPPKPESIPLAKTNPASSTTSQPKVPEKNPNDGTFQIEHTEKPATTSPSTKELGAEEPQIHIDAEGTLSTIDSPSKTNSIPSAPNALNVTGGSPVILTPPSLGGRLTANSEPEPLEPSTDPLSLPAVEPPLLSRDDNTNPVPPYPLADSATTPDLDSARNAVQAAASNSAQPLSPRIDLNAQPVFGNIQPLGQPDSSLGSSSSPLSPAPFMNEETSNQDLTPPQPVPNLSNVSAPADESAHTLTMPMPRTAPQSLDTPSTQSGYDEDVPSGAPSDAEPRLGDSTPPPPVPPPMVPPPVF